MKREEIEAILEDWLKAWKCCDPLALTAPYSEQAVYHSTLAGTIHGHQEIIELYRSWFRAFPEMRFEVDCQLIDGDHVALFWSQRGQHTGEFCGLAGTGRSFLLPGVFLMTFQDGRIVRMQSFYDFTGLLLQIGALKAKPAI